VTSLAIKFSGVNKHYTHFDLKNINLELPNGNIMGFIGPNGAGKSTTIRILMGLAQQDSGEVTVMGKSIPKEQVAAKWDIGFASEDMRLYPRATLNWHMQFIQSIYPKWDTAYAQELIQRFDLTPAQKLKGFSHGQRVKASLLLILARRPKLLVLDEPTTGLDPVARQEVLAELMEVLRDEERTILFSSHNTQDVEQLSDLITFIDGGQIIASKDKETFLESWRRLRLDVAEGSDLPTLPGIIKVQKMGRQVIVTMNEFQPEVTSAYQQNGVTVRSVENMTLEEIFVANVQANRGKTN
jgi:ABC-2 type transport system ATP-binding protein